MKIVFFKNKSGDPVYPVFRLISDLTKEQIEKEIGNRIGDDYYFENDNENVSDEGKWVICG